MIFNKLKKVSTIITLLIVVAMSLIATTEAFAGNTAVSPSLNKQVGFDDSTKIKEAFGGQDTPIGVVVGNVINIALGFLGIIFVVILVMAGFKYFMAQGNTTKTTEAMASIKTAVIGLVIILLSYSITKFVMDHFADITGSTGS